LTWEEAVLWLRAQADQGDLVRACFYDDPLLQAAERYHASSEWAAIRELLPPKPGRALDLGAGRGISSYALAREGWSTTALEPDPSEIVGAGAIRSLAAKSGLPIAVCQQPAERLPFADDSFDLVLGRAVMHHTRDLESFCREACRVLAPGGLFIGVREHVVSSPAQLRAFLEAHPLHRHYGGEHAYRLREYVEAMRGSGFRIRKVLNPFASEINLFPDSREALRRRIATSLRLPSPALVSGWMLKLLGVVHRAPGRLYSFVAVKPHG
jgi:SAM-dependent methyltransferase